MSAGRVGVMVSAVVGLLAGVACWLWNPLGGTEEQQTPYFVGDRVQQAIEGVADDGIFVSPEARDLISVEAERRLATELAEHRDLPVALVIWHPTDEAG